MENGFFLESQMSAIFLKKLGLAVSKEKDGGN
jgi:hypothetical protein